MILNLCLCNCFETDFRNKHYYIYQFVDSTTLSILNYSTEESIPYKIGDYVDCEVGIKNSKLYVLSVSTK